MDRDEEYERFQRFKRFEEQERASAPRERSLRELFDDWLRTLTGAYQRTVAARGKYLDIPVRCAGTDYVLGKLAPSQCSVAILSSWQLALSTQPGRRFGKALKSSSADQVWVALRTCLNWHVKSGELKLNPMGKVARMPRKLRNIERQGYYTPDELERVAAEMPLIGGYILRHVFATGCRRDNIRTLRKHQIDWGAKDLIVIQKGGEPLRVAVPDATLDEIRALAALAPGDYVYPSPKDPRGPVSTATLWKWIQQASRRSGVTSLAGEKPTIHHARHGRAVDLLERGAALTEVQAQLGHASIEQTVRYAKMRDRARDRLRDYMNRPKDDGSK